MSYGLRGCDGRVRGLGIVGLGAVPPTPPPDVFCSVLDQTCVSNNVARWNAYQAELERYHTQSILEDCQAAARKNSSPQQVADALARCQGQADVMSGVPAIVYDSSGPNAPPVGSTYDSSTGAVTWPVAPAAAPVAPAARAAASATPAATVAEGAPTLTPTLALPTVGGFDLSSIPWYGWLGAGALALFAFGGGRGR